MMCVGMYVVVLQFMTSVMPNCVQLVIDAIRL